MRKDSKSNIRIEKRQTQISNKMPDDISEIFSYQLDAVSNLEVLDRTFPDYYSTLVVIPTGGGKTRIAVEYLYKNAIDRKGCKVLWIAERLLLLEQTYETFKKLADREHLSAKEESEVITRLISSKHGSYENTSFHKDVDLVIITQQTLEKKIDRKSRIVSAMKEWLTGAECLTIVIDEAHHATAEPYKAILMSLLELKKEGVFQKCHVIGLTATPKREQCNDIENIFSFGVMEEEGKPVAVSQTSYAYQISVHDLVIRKVLSIPYMAQIEAEADKDDVILQTYLDGASGLHFYEGQTGREGSAEAEAVPDFFGQTILFAESRVHALKLEKRFLEAGVNCGLAISIDKKFEEIFNKEQEESLEDYLGKTIIEKKRQISDNIKKYEEGNLPLIITVNMLMEGVDFPKTQTVFIAKEAADDVDVTQMVGRGLRGIYQGGTPTAFIISFGKEKLEKFLWEIPDSYVQDRYGKELNEEYSLSKSSKTASSEISLLTEHEFCEGTFGEKEKNLIIQLDADIDRTDRQQLAEKLEKRLIERVIQSQTAMFPTGYYLLGKRALLVWANMEVWIDEARTKIDQLIDKHNIDADSLKSTDTFRIIANEIIRENVVFRMGKEETDLFLPKGIEERYLWHIIRFYMIQCGQCKDTFLRETQLHSFVHLEQYDLSGILKESFGVEPDEIEGFMEQMWMNGSKDMHSAWHDKEIFKRFLSPKISRFNSIPIVHEDGEGGKGYFRVRLFRNGRKRNDLCEMLGQILRYKPDCCNRFVDVFGGTGTVSAQMKGVFEKRVYNDFDVLLAEFIFCISDSTQGKGFARFCYERLGDLYSENWEQIVKGIYEINTEICENGLGDSDILKALDIPDLDKTIQGKINNLNIHAEEKKGRYREKYNEEIEGKGIPLEQHSIYRKRKQYLLRRYEELTRQKKMLEDENIGESVKRYIAFYHIANRLIDRLSGDNEFCMEQRTCINNRKNLKYDEMCKRAFAFLFSMGFESNRVSGTSVTGVNPDGIKRFNNSLNWKKGTSWISDFHEKMEGVEVFCKDFRDILKQYGNADTVFYLDPPYFLTCQYNEGFPDEFHLDMLEWIRSTECKWVLSCKDEGTNYLEAMNWNGRLGANKKSIYVPDMEPDGGMPRLDEYFKGFLYPMVEFKPDTSYLRCAGCRNSEGVSVYHADVGAEKIGKDKLYVYKLSEENNSEIMISNIEVKEPDRKVLKDRGIEVKEFESYFHLMFKNAR